MLVLYRIVLFENISKRVKCVCTTELASNSLESAVLVLFSTGFKKLECEMVCNNLIMVVNRIHRVKQCIPVNRLI